MTDDAVGQMRAWCQQNGHSVLGYDERINEAAAAAVLGYCTETLRGWRQEGSGPRYFRVRGRISYRLADLAQWLAAERATNIEPDIGCRDDDEPAIGDDSRWDDLMAREGRARKIG